MKVIVCGAGQVGYSIARHLASQQNDVTVIDRSPELIRKIGDSLDVQAIEGYASDPSLLHKANAAEADMLIAVTWSDEVNMVACQVAHSLFDVPIKIARLRRQNYMLPEWQDLFSRDNMPIDVIISPEREVAEAVHRRLEVPGAFDVFPFVGGVLRVIGVQVDDDCPILHTPLRQLTELFPDMTITIMGIIRDQRTFVPGGDDHLESGDCVYFVVDSGQIERAMSVFGMAQEETRRVVIIGGGNVGLFLAEHLIENNPEIRVKVIEHDSERASFVADRLPKAVVLHGDGLDAEILEEANVGRAETIVTLTNDDETNILASLLAKRQGAKRSVALINNLTYGPLMSSLGIDVFIDPRETTVSTILQHIRKGRIRDLHSIRNGAAEILEAEALETSPAVGRSIRKLKLPSGVMVGAIVRDGEVILPRSDTVFEKGDRVVIFALQEDVKTIEQLFAVQLEFF